MQLISPWRGQLMITMCKSSSQCSENIFMLSTTFPAPGQKDKEWNVLPHNWQLCLHPSTVRPSFLGLSSSNVVLLFYPLCELSGSFLQKCSFSAQDHQIPSTSADLLDHSVAWANLLLELHFQSSLQRGMGVKANKPSSSAEVWQHMYA